jgi:hypothetical protein
MAPGGGVKLEDGVVCEEVDGDIANKDVVEDSGSDDYGEEEAVAVPMLML